MWKRVWIGRSASECRELPKGCGMKGLEGRIVGGRRGDCQSRPLM